MNVSQYLGKIMLWYDSYQYCEKAKDLFISCKLLIKRSSQHNLHVSNLQYCQIIEYSHEIDFGCVPLMYKFCHNGSNNWFILVSSDKVIPYSRQDSLWQSRYILLLTLLLYWINLCILRFPVYCLTKTENSVIFSMGV